MSIISLFEYLDRTLANNESVAIDGDTFRRITHWPDVKWTRTNVHQIAWTLVKLRPDLVVSSEAFLDIKTMEVKQVYLVCARSAAAYRAGVTKIQERVARELAGKIVQTVEYPHLHSQPEEAAAPSELIEPMPHERVNNES